MKTSTKLLLGALGLGVVGFAVYLIGGTASAKSGAPTRSLPGSGALVFGNVSDSQIPRSFNPDGNMVWFSPDCSAVVVGRSLWHTPGQNIGDIPMLSCIEPEDGELMTALRNGQNLCAFIDYLMNNGVLKSSLIVAAILRGLEAPCSGPAASWPQPMQNFVQWLREHVDVFVGEAGGEVDW